MICRTSGKSNTKAIRLGTDIVALIKSAAIHTLSSGKMLPMNIRSMKSKWYVFTAELPKIYSVHRLPYNAQPIMLV